MKDKKIHSFINVISNKKWKKVLLMFVGIILLNSLISVTTSFSPLGNIVKIFFNLNVGPEDEVKSVEILSDKDQGPGSFKVTKSANWTKGNEAEITFKVDSNLKIVGDPIDIILVLDTSESMAVTKYVDGKSVSKIAQVKSDAQALTNTILANQESRIALVEFNSHAYVKSDFTNDASKINNLISNLGAYEATDYKDALVKAQDVLKGTCDVCSGSPYVPSENRELVILFLSDGYPVRETPYEVGEYEKIKTEYPNITINAIQYELGDKIAKELIDISDHQYVSYIGNLRNVLYAASTAIKFYEKLDITDLIDTDSFEVKSASDIKVSDGTFQFDKENQSIIWHVSEYDESLEQYTFMTSHSAEMKIKIYLKDDLKNMTGLYPTNKKEEIDYKLEEEKEQKITETKVPKLYNGYTLTYDYNLPNECRDSYKTTTESEIRSILDVIDTTKKEAPVCDSYQFQGWVLTATDERHINGENDEEMNYKINDTSFKMPWKDIRLMGVWTKFGITKQMEGGIYKERTIPLINRIKESGIDPTLGRIPRDDESSTYVTGAKINFGAAPSDTNGKGLYIRAGAEKGEGDFTGETIYYYRGNVTNNNVIFAGFCWQIVRTTETGGIKLIYNGVPSNSQCSNTGSVSQIGISAFNSSYDLPAYNGYMYGTVYNSPTKTMMGTSSLMSYSKVNTDKTGYFFSKTPPRFDTEKQKYVFDDYVKQTDETWTTTTNALENGGNGYYSCLDGGINECEKVYYILGKYNSNNYYRLDMTVADAANGSTIETAASNKRMKLSQEIVDNGDETYSLVNPIEVSYVEWWTTFSNYNGYYMCFDSTKDTCAKDSIRVISSPTKNSYNWTNAEPLTFGNDVEYVDGVYHLKNVLHKNKETAWNSSNYSTKHYMCMGNSESCETVYYIFYSYSRSNGYYIRYIPLKGEANIEEVLEKMFSNEKNSTIKNSVDNWYNWYIKNNYEKYLEDAVWCNDRSIVKKSDYAGWHKDNSYDNYNLYYGAYGGRNIMSSTVNLGLRDELACPNKNDRFTKESESGNKALVNPVGLITADEATAAGHGWTGYSKNSYLYTGKDYWTLSPITFNSSSSDYGFIVDSSGNLFEEWGYERSGVRPALSLNSGVEVLENGDGTAIHPYVVR